MPGVPVLNIPDILEGFKSQPMASSSVRSADVIGNTEQFGSGQRPPAVLVNLGLSQVVRHSVTFFSCM